MDKLPENELFYCEHLSDTIENLNLIKNFTVTKSTGIGLLRYLKFQSIYEEKENLAKTYLVKDKETNELVGYFSLKAGMVSTNETVIEESTEFDSLPGIELSNFAVNSSYKEAHKEYEGIGKIIFIYFILPILLDVSKNIGVHYLYIFALPFENLIRYYKSLNFTRLNSVEEHLVHKRIRPHYDKNCIFMYQRLHN